MDDIVTFRQPVGEQPETRTYQDGAKDNKIGPSTDIMPEPIDGASMPQSILDVLGINGNARDLPSDEMSNLQEIASYLEESITKSGKVPSIKTMGSKLDEIREQLDMDDDTEASVILDRVGGVVKAWKGLGFMTDPSQKRSLFMRLARCKDSKEMHRLVYHEMDKHTW